MATPNSFPTTIFTLPLFIPIPEMEFLHFYILQLVQSHAGSKLQIDNLVMDMIAKTLSAVTDYKPNEKIHARLKKNHLTTIERAKEYITGQFHFRYFADGDR